MIFKEIQTLTDTNNEVKYSQVPLWHSLIYHDVKYNTAITVAESESDIRITTDTPYLALTGELWGVYCEWVSD